jgi:hypothetical protein
MIRAIAIILLLLAPGLAPAAEKARPDSGKAAAGSAFDHRGHLSNAPECDACHQPGDLSITPDLARCDDCHDKGFGAGTVIPAPTTHGGFWYRDHKVAARAAFADCAFCHEQKDCEDCHRAGFADGQGKTNIHRSDFRVTHPIGARENGNACASCHEAGFCSDCHERFNPADLAFESHRKGWSDIPGVGGVVHSAYTEAQCRMCHTGGLVLPPHQWSTAHAREARRSLPTCQSCHPGGDVCLRCHSAREGLIVNPHPKNWDDMKDNLNKASGGRTCRRCH